MNHGFIRFIQQGQKSLAESNESHKSLLGRLLFHSMIGRFAVSVKRIE